jgi:transcriptional regulator with XRE-family HTH domain
MANHVTRRAVRAQEHFGHRLRQLRIRADITQAELARRLEISREAISMMERRGHADWAVKARRLAQALGCHPGELFEPLPALSGEEAALLAKIRSLNPHARETVLELVDQLAPSPRHDRRKLS